MSPPREAVIAGAGVAGLTAGYLLARAGFRVTVLEKERSVGGLARSFRYGDFVFDVGPHRFHTDDAEVLAFIRRILGGECLLMPRRSGVRLFGRYHDWPLRPSTLLKLPPGIIARLAADLWRRRPPAGPSFEEYILHRYGRTLYEYFFRAYTLKFLKRPPASIHADWARMGIDRAVIDRNLRMGTLTEVLRNALLPVPVRTEFIYPARGGIDTFGRNLAREIERAGGAVRTGVAPAAIERGGEGIAAVRLDGGERLPADVLLWTGPLHDICGLAGAARPALDYLSAILYNVEIEGEPRVRYQWCYYGEEGVSFNRVSVPRYFSAATCPAGATGLGLEVTCGREDALWREPEERAGMVAAELERVGLVRRGARVRAVHVERVENVYPVYTLDYRDRLERATRPLAALRNLALLGRTAAFWYNNMDHSIRAGMACAADVIGGSLRPAYRGHALERNADGG
ncbi:MAG: FAD-dependent oxidoreductase [bacterium]|nr:FAD-dependent oxidoreductase [bacterium]